MAVRKKASTKASSSPEPPVEEVPVDTEQEALDAKEAEAPFRPGEYEGRAVMVHRNGGQMYDVETGEQIFRPDEPEPARSAKRAGRPSKATQEVLAQGDADVAKMQEDEWEAYRQGRYKAFKKTQMALGNLENCPEQMPDDFVPPEIAEHPVMRMHVGSMPPFLRKLFQKKQPH